jgi:hypothetical protein
MNPESNSSLTKVTPLSKALAAIIFIVLPFVGLYIGYTFAPEKVVERVVENTEPQEFISRDLLHYVANVSNRFDPDGYPYSVGVSRQTNFFAFIPRDENKMYLYELSYNTRESKLFRAFTSSTLSLLNNNYKRYYTYLLPNNEGTAIYMNGSEGCGGCDKYNEAVLYFGGLDGEERIFPLMIPLIESFQWEESISDENILRYRYKTILEYSEECVDTDTIPDCPLSDWQYGEINTENDNYLPEWSGEIDSTN